MALHLGGAHHLPFIDATFVASRPDVDVPAARTVAIEAISSSLAERYEPGVGVRLGTGAWLVSAQT